MKGRGAPQTLEAGVIGQPWLGNFGQELLKLRLDWWHPRESQRLGQEGGAHNVGGLIREKMT